MVACPIGIVFGFGPEVIRHAPAAADAAIRHAVGADGNPDGHVIRGAAGARSGLVGHFQMGQRVGHDRETGRVLPDHGRAAAAHQGQERDPRFADIRARALE